MSSGFGAFEGNHPNMQARKRNLPYIPTYAIANKKSRAPLANFITRGALPIGWENGICPYIPIFAPIINRRSCLILLYNKNIAAKVPDQIGGNAANEYVGDVRKTALAADN